MLLGFLVYLMGRLRPLLAYRAKSVSASARAISRRSRSRNRSSASVSSPAASRPTSAGARRLNLLRNWICSSLAIVESGGRGGEVDSIRRVSKHVRSFCPYCQIYRCHIYNLVTCNWLSEKIHRKFGDPWHRSGNWGIARVKSEPISQLLIHASNTKRTLQPICPCCRVDSVSRIGCVVCFFPGHQ